jgi:hypothetical protein
VGMLCSGSRPAGFRLTRQGDDHLSRLRPGPLVSAAANAPSVKVGGLLKRIRRLRQGGAAEGTDACKRGGLQRELTGCQWGCLHREPGCRGERCLQEESAVEGNKCWQGGVTPESAFSGA